MLSHRKHESHGIERLRAEVTGSVVLPGDKEYDEQRTPWLQVVEQHPSVIVNATGAQDIVGAVRLARELDLPIGVQNTGHGIALPCNQGVLLRLGGMKQIDIDAVAGIATIGPGISSGEFLAALEPQGFVFPSGQVSNVGVVGYTLGGGYGWLGRKWGVACQAVQSAIVIVADGSVVRTSATEQPDLLWAIRGGGGNFGVVASLTLEIRRLGKIFGGMVYYRMADAPEILRFYQDWSANLSENTSTVLRLMRVPPTPRMLLHLLSTETCAIGICHTDLATAEDLHRQIRAFKIPAIDDLKVRPYSEMASFDQASSESGSPTFSHVECLRDLNEAVLTGVVEIAKSRVPPLVLLELQHLHGNSGGLSSDAMAYTAPTGSYWLKLVSPALNTTLEELAPVTKEAFNSLGDVFTGEPAFNWMRGDQQPRIPEAFGREKYERLQMLKRRFDPGNLFRLNLNIPPA